MSIYNQYKKKPKKVVDPLAPPRPNLLSHDKTIREMNIEFESLKSKSEIQSREIEKLSSRIRNMFSEINGLRSFLNKR